MSFFLRKSTLLTLLGIGIAVGGMSHFISDSATAEASTPPAKPAIHVEATPATSDTLAQSLQAVGSLMANESVELRSEITGRVENIQFKDGQKVKAKDILFTLEDSVQKAELARAKANLNVSERNVSRYGTLASKGFSS
ncbi:MAG: biotin/lipoyl-binding protein, partial [Alphaproteobacteria bacterium]|nr:biotin/lipoyl-binding protein [Alphaproteobacteria bacterium]